MVKETVKYIDDTEVEIDVFRLGFRQAMTIAKSHIPINDLTFNKDESMSIRGDVDLFTLSVSCLETIKDLDVDKLTSEDATRIYKTYFEKDIMGSLGKGGNPQ